MIHKHRILLLYLVVIFLSACSFDISSNYILQSSYPFTPSSSNVSTSTKSDEVRLPNEVQYYSDGDSFGVDIIFNGTTNALAGLYQYVEDGLYYMITESKTSSVVHNAYQVLSDGTRILIEDLRRFSLAYGLEKIEVVFEPGVPVEGLSFSRTQYIGYYIDRPYTIQLDYSLIPSDATNNYVKFISSNPSIVSVDPFGKVTVKKSGNVVVSAISLDGNIKATLQMNIKSGSAILKDSVRNDDLIEEPLIGTRFDDFSGQGSIYNDVVLNQTQTKLIAVGASTYTTNQTTAMIYRYPLFSSNHDSALNSDSANIMYSEELVSVEKKPQEDEYYAVGNAIVQSGNKRSGYLVSFRNVSTVDSTTLALNDAKLFSKNNEDVFFTDVTYFDSKIFIVGYRRKNDISTLFQDVYTSFIVVYDELLNLVDEITFNDIRTLDVIKRSSSGKVLMVAGVQNTSTFIATYDLNTEQLNKAYFSNIQDAKITDFDFISDVEIIAVGQGIINTRTSAFTTRFAFINDSFQSVNTVKNEFFDHTYASSVHIANGVVIVVGYAKYKENIGLFNNWDWEYATVKTFTTGLEFINAKSFYNNNHIDNKGIKQRFVSSTLSTYNELFAVGGSNYVNLSYDTAYIQYNIDFIS